MKGAPPRRLTEPARPTVYQTVPGSTAQAVLHDLRSSSLIFAEEWDVLPQAVRHQIQNCANPSELVALLVEHRLLTEYQAGRVAAGKTFGLILGHYRILDRLGAGGMGVVYKGEHLRLRRLVAIKVLSVSRNQPSKLLHRFYTEMRTIAQLRHPNIVAAMDAGETTEAHPDGATLHYLVMEYVPGPDLEALVRASGPLAPGRACDLIHQVASALGEAHQHQLVHRDIKPSNVLVTPEGQAKLLDFGLARHFRHRMTEPGTMLGSIDYIAPEQVRDAGSVDIRADLYALGGTLFWCLTGHTPFLPKHDLAEELNSRLTQQPPSARNYRPEIPAELDAVIARLMACDPAKRYPTPQAVMSALLPFLRPESREEIVLQSLTAHGKPAPPRVTVHSLANTPRVHRVLIADDDAFIRQFCRLGLEEEGVQCEEAENGLRGLEMMGQTRYDLALLDWSMPEMDGLEVCRQLRRTPPSANLKIILFSAHGTNDDVGRVLAAGADDYLTKPFSTVQLAARVKAALRLKDAQDRSDLLNRHLLTVNHELEQNVNARDVDLIHARNALVLALAKLVEYRDSETGAHLVRLQRFSRCLAEEASLTPTFGGRIDANFVEMLECCAPLHDIGKVGLPDHILLKPGKLDADERIIMQAHTVIGGDTLKAVLKQHGSAVAFLQMALDIARHHHERFDGRGYPDRLAGAAIPLAARIVTICDVYDALRSRRTYKPALSHNAAVQIMTEASDGQFDPALLEVFQRCGDHFDRIFQELADG
jgi:response regulator RpfG family c-di-GMP phosphodiesterase/serine/threonine protein kinase